MVGLFEVDIPDDPGVAPEITTWYSQADALLDQPSVAPKGLTFVEVKYTGEGHPREISI